MQRKAVEFWVVSGAFSALLAILIFSSHRRLLTRVHRLVRVTRESTLLEANYYTDARIADLKRPQEGEDD